MMTSSVTGLELLPITSFLDLLRPSVSHTTAKSLLHAELSLLVSHLLPAAGLDKYAFEACTEYLVSKIGRIVVSKDRATTLLECLNEFIEKYANKHRRSISSYLCRRDLIEGLAQYSADKVLAAIVAPPREKEFLVEYRAVAKKHPASMLWTSTRSITANFKALLKRFDDLGHLSYRNGLVAAYKRETTMFYLQLSAGMQIESLKNVQKHVIK